jgi:hypothetical protein
VSEASRKTKKQLLLLELTNMPIVEVACKRSSVSRATYYRWRNEDEEFKEASDKALQDAIELMSDMAESQLLNSVKDGNMTGIIFWLKNHREAYSNKISIKRIEAERDHYKQALRDKADDPHDTLRELVDQMKALAAHGYDEEAYKAEQEATRRKALRSSDLG